MSLDKAIEHGREWRKPYYRSAQFDRSCRPHGSCSYCERNRLHKNRRREAIHTIDPEELDTYTHNAMCT